MVQNLQKNSAWGWMRSISLRHHWQTTKERSREAEGIRPEKIEDKISHHLFADLQLLVDEMVEAVVLVIIFALVQRIVLHMFGQSGLHLVYVYPCWRHLWCIVNQCGVTYVVWLCWYRFQSWWTDFWREPVSLFGRLFILPDTFCLIYAIPEEDADAFRGIKSQGGNLTLCFCGWEVQAETTAIRIIRFLWINCPYVKRKICTHLNLGGKISVWVWRVGIRVKSAVNPIGPLQISDNMISNGRQVFQKLKRIFLVMTPPTNEGSSGDVFSQIIVEGV